MIRKKTLFIAIILSVFGMTILVPTALAGWTASITAEGEEVGGAVKKAEVIIGVSTIAKTQAAPPEPDEFTVMMYLRPADLMEKYYSDIKDNDTEKHEWILDIKPAGNKPPPVTRTSLITWEPTTFGPGTFTLYKEADGSGGIAVPDMKSVNQYAVQGIMTETSKFFLIRYEPDLSYVISILQLTAGISPADFDFFMDVDQDEKVGLPEAVYMLQDVAGLR